MIGGSVGTFRVGAMGMARRPFVVDGTNTFTMNWNTSAGDGTVTFDANAQTIQIVWGTTGATLARGSTTVEVGRWYRVAWTVAGTTGSCQSKFGTAAGGSQYRADTAVAAGSTNNFFDFYAASATLWINFQRTSAGTTTISAISVQKLQ